MPNFRLSYRATALAAIAVLAFAFAFVVHQSGPNQAAHFALVRSLANGTAEIDPHETIDAAYVDDRYYAAKAPGLALFALPWYGALRAAGLQAAPLDTDPGYTRRVWELNLFGAVLPAIVLLLLVVLAVERVCPGYGAATAVLLGAGTMLLPFATLFFDHALSAALGFAAFVVLLRERDGPSRLRLVAGAGVLAGLAVVAEFPLALVALVLAGYAAARAEPLRRASVFVAGSLAGVLPLLAFNTWAFGSPLRLSYTNALVAPVGDGPPSVGANDDGFYGVGVPDPRAALSLLVSEKGLAIVAPIAIVALIGLPLLWRSGRRAETLVCAGIAMIFLAYNAAYYLPWGGQAPGPRFLVPVLPFLALPLAMALRARPLAVAGIGVLSIAVTVLATFTDPLTGEEDGLAEWWELMRSSELVGTVATRLGVDSAWVGVLPFLLAVAVACGAALATLPLRGRLRADGPLLAGAVGAWIVLAFAAPGLLPANEEHGTLEGSLAAALLVALIVAAAALGVRYGPAALLPALPVLVLTVPSFDDRPRLALAAVAACAAVAVTTWVVRRGTWRPGAVGGPANDGPLGDAVAGDPAV